ncbi:tetratricopeptide repeat protein [Undibacterium sp. Di27W]|uniref:tetratricopeptide repeat protein n=1 Tax=Undibacterium sp. Di27W TaxID=3413036 RepID=UPI003BF36DF9
MGFEQNIIIMAENIDDTMELPSLLLHYDYSARKRACNCWKKDDALVYTYQRKNDYHINYLETLSILYPTVRFTLFEQAPCEWGNSRIIRLLNGLRIDRYTVCSEKRYFALYFHLEVFYQWFRHGGHEESTRKQYFRTFPYEFMGQRPFEQDCDLYFELAYNPAPYDPETGYQMRANFTENPAFYGWVRCPLQVTYGPGDRLFEQLIKVREIEFERDLLGFNRDKPFPDPLAKLYLKESNITKVLELYKTTTEFLYAKYNKDFDSRALSNNLKVFVSLLLDFGLITDAQHIAEQAFSNIEKYGAQSDCIKEILLELARVYRVQYRFEPFRVISERAIKYFAECPKFSAEDVLSLLQFALWSAEMQQFEFAEELIGKTVSIFSKNNLVWSECNLIKVEVVRGDICHLQGKNAEALSAYVHAYEAELVRCNNQENFFSVRQIREKILTLQGKSELAIALLADIKRPDLDGLDETALAEAANGGNLDAQLLMANISNDRSPKPSEDFPLPHVWEYYESTLVYWYGKAAAQGDAMAQCRMGDMYMTGMGVMYDFKIAIDWYHKSAEQGHGPAMKCLGMLYKNGLGVHRDLQQASVWFERCNPNAAEKYMETRIFELF